MTPQDRKFVWWVGIRDREVTWDGPEAIRARDAMRDGYSRRSAGVDLVAVQTDEEVSYGHVIKVFERPPLLVFNGLTHFHMSTARIALAELGITGPVNMFLAEADVVSPVV